MSEPRIEVDLDALRENVRMLRDDVGRPIMAVVKANGYGHGAAAVARAAIEGGAEMLGVVDIAEALALRAAGITAPIVAWLHGPSTDWITAIEADIEVGVSSIEQFELLATAAPLADRPARVHIKVDTGLGRNGALERDWGAMLTLMRVLQGTGAGVFAGLFSHLSGTSHASDLSQVDAFARALTAADRRGVTPGLRHLAASAAAIDEPESRFDLVRIGIAMYGLTPFAPDVAPRLPLRSVLRLTAPIVRGDEVAGTAAGRIDLGTVDGLPPLDADAAARLRVIDEQGRQWRLGAIGEVSTDVHAAAARDAVARDAAARNSAPVSDAAGRVAATWLTIMGGEASSADEWAQAADTIGYEIVTRLVARLERREIDGPGVPAPDARLTTPPRTIRTLRGLLAPRRILTIDLRRLRERMSAQLASGVAEFDVSADAYGLGLGPIAGLAREVGLEPIVRTTADSARTYRQLGTVVRVVPDADPRTRAAYGFDETPDAVAVLEAGADAGSAARGGGVLRLVSELVHVKRVSAGQGVSYGYEWTADRPTTLGLVPIGYGDALTRRCAPGTRLRLMSQPTVMGDHETPASLFVPIVGRVAMDQVVVDLGDTEAWPGMPVVVFGSETGDPSLAEVAERAGLTPAAFVASLGSRVVTRFATA